MKKRGAPWLLLTLTVGLLGGAIYLAVRRSDAGVAEFRIVDFIWGSGWLAFPVVGTIIASRRPENPVGWLATAFALPIVLMVFADEYATNAIAVSRDLPGGHFMLWLSQWPFFVAAGLIILMFLVFPDGKLPSKRWRFVPYVVAAVTLVGAAAAAVGRNTSDPRVAENPLFIPKFESISEGLQGIAGSALGALLVLAIASIFIRFRKAPADERRQVKWFLYGLGVLLGLLLLSFILEDVTGFDIPETVDTLLFVAAVTAPPVGMGIAILRHGLYDIDVVINKTVVYGALAGFITAIYVGIVVGIGTLVGAGDKPNLGLSLAATAIVAFAFQPVRQRVQRFANRLVYGQRITPYEAISSFSHRMAESLSLDQVLPKMAEAAAQGVGGVRSLVKLFLPNGRTQQVHWPIGSDENSFDKTLRVIHRGEEVGEIAVAKAPGEPLTTSEDKLLQDLASQAGLAMRNLRLTSELEQRLIELQESRKRIVAAQDEERRRMERDIHDGAQQQLVAMAVKLSLAKTLAEKDADKASQMLDQIKSETEEVVDSIRDLARGIFPPLLADKGMGAAIDSHLNKLTINATLNDETRGSRFPQEIEAACYFTIREALQNAAKHAQNQPISITITCSGDHLLFRVQDEGPGFDMGGVHKGSGLENMRDRIEAVGGAFKIRSSPDRGTTVEGRIPVRALERAS